MIMHVIVPCSPIPEFAPVIHIWHARARLSNIYYPKNYKACQILFRKQSIMSPGSTDTDIDGNCCSSQKKGNYDNNTKIKIQLNNKDTFEVDMNNVTTGPSNIIKGEGEIISKTTSSLLERQLSKNLGVLKAGPRLIVPPAQHLLTTALKIPLGAKKSLIDNNLSRLRSHDSSNNDMVNDIDREEESDGESGDNNSLGNNLSSDVDIDDEDIEHGIVENLRPGTIESTQSISRERTKSPSNSNARRQTLSPQRLMNSISRHSLSPLRTRSRRKSTLMKDEPTVEGISRSFAGFLTTASMYAGFQDIEDEDREVESMRHKDSRDSESSVDVISGPPVDANHLQILDEDDDNSDLISEISTPTATMSVATDGTFSKGNDHNTTIYKNKTPGSKFDVSIVQKVTNDALLHEERDALEKKALAISNKLREAFDIDHSEEFIADYPCWLMGDVLLQGHLYITDNNILFFAFLPKRNKGGIYKSGSLSVKSFHSLRMHRKWTILRENTFSVYSSAKDLYFPELVIDLRTALRAEVYGTSKSLNPLTPVWIRIVTEKRTHWFQADNHDIARAWVTSIKKHIFSSRNKGDQVAIKIPLQNVIDLELTSVVGVTKNLRIKVIENAESFAIDDYFIMFFSKGDSAAHDIKKAIDKSGVVISSSLVDDNENLKNSELVKSKLEIIKKSCSSVKSTNFRPKEKKSKFREFRDSILSSDEENDDSFNYQSCDSDGNMHDKEDSFMCSSKEKSLDGILATDSTVKLNNEKPLLLPKLMRKSRTKSVHIVPEIYSNVPIQSVVDTTHTSLKEETNRESRRWGSSLVQGITSFTQNFIFSGPVSHFDENAISKEGQDPNFVKDEKVRELSQKRFITRFSLPDTEKLIATYHLYLVKGLPIYGKLYIGQHQICFRSTVPGTSTIMILPLSDIETVNKESGFRFGYFGLVLVIRGHEELFFEFSGSDSRDDCEIQILQDLDKFKKNNSFNGSLLNSSDTKLESSAISLSSAKLKMFENKLTDAVGVNVPIVMEDHPLQKTEIKPLKSYRFTLLTIGSRGDVQPYIALGKALMKEGHTVKIVTHAEFKDWVEGYGIGFDVIAGDPSELMSLMVTHPAINYSFIKEAKAKFRDWIDDLLNTSWKACQDCDVLIESPSSISGIHIAEKLQIPYFRAFTMPWTRTRAYPNAFMVPDQKLGGAYNYMTHVAFENGYWRGTCYQVNKWRVETLGLPKTTLSAMHQNSVPFLYNISPVVFPPSVDFPEWVKVTGYWFLDESNNYEPSQKLTEFIQKARDDNKKLVYIGFGSIVVENPKELTKAVVGAVLDSDVRCILNKGWSDRLGSKNKNDIEIELPDEIFNSGNVPHDWLFTQIDAAVHHGGSGTTGASLRFGLPTIIKPFFGDQKFYANRVEDMGCGVALKSLESKQLAKALKEVTTNSRIIETAKQVGERIRSENGVQNAVNDIYVLVDYATKLSVSKHKDDLAEDMPDDMEDLNDGGDVEGSWLLV